MSSPRYRHAHQQERARLRPVVAAGQAYCAEPICLFKTRLIPPTWAPTQLWHVSHDPTGTVVIGPSHRRCNLAEAARRGNAMRSTRRRTGGKRSTSSPPPTRRWVL